MTTFLGSYERPRRQPLGETSRIGRLVRLSEDTLSAVVELGNEQFELPVSPGKYVLGANVAVLESKGKPRRVSGPAGVWPEGLDADADAPDTVTAVEQLGPRELTEAEAQAIQDTAGGLAETQGRVDAAEGLLDAIGASDGPDGVADAISDYLAIPLDQITIVDNRGADGNVIANLYDAIIVDGLLTASGVITEDLIATGAIESRHLNVVPEEGTGGMELLPPGLRIIPPDAEAGTAVSLRIDEPNWFSFAKGGFNTFSVNEDGDMTGRSLDVRETLKVGGVPIETILDERPRGIITKTKMTQAAIVGNAVARLVMATIETPSTPRAYKLTFGFHRQSASRMQITFRQSIGTTVAAGNTIQEYWYVARTADATADYVEINHLVPSSEAAWGLGNTVTFGFFAESLQAGETITFDPTHGVTMVVEDVGPAVDVTDSIPYVPSTGGGDGQGSDTGTTKKYYDGKFYPASSRSYRGDNTAYDWNTSMLFHGYNLSANGQLRSLAVFNRTAVNGLVSGSGTDMVSGHIKLFNAHTYSSQGMTVRVGYSNHTATPTSWDGSAGEWTWIGNYTVSRGGVLTIPLTATHLARIKSGAFNAIGLVSNANTSAQYGYFRASKTELYVKVRK